jgi:hypothetical protein
MVLQQSATFPDLAANFYRDGIARTAAALAGWLRDQVKKKRLALDNVDEAAGMMIGMMVSAPQRAAIYANLTLPSREEIEMRARVCAAILLDGCRERRR